MSLAPGTRLGSYEVASALGAGGMGEVYRARDTQLNRDVAIKILPDVVAHDADRVARFTREAQTLAALNHPNIAQIYGVVEAPAAPDLGGSSAHVHALVMELVEGEDLSAVIARGAIPLADALPIARQVADALEAAHEQGIIHRDLKPANIKLRPDGTVKVLDFGLAKGIVPGSQDPGLHHETANSPTMTSPAMTSMGMILGTAAYMAPEQARGKTVDKRADIWAFGVVLYEMLTGRRVFGGEDVSDVLAAVLRQEVDWGALPPTVPANLVSLLRRCLERDPKRRLRDASDVRLLVEDATLAPAPLRPAEARRPRWRERLAWMLAVAGIGASLVLAWRHPAARPDDTLTYFTVTLPDDQPLAFVDVPTIALSPDGRALAFTVRVRSGQTLIHLQSFDQPEARPLLGTEGGSSPFFSPDGASLGFFANGRLKTVSLTGGAVVNVAEAPTPRGAVWERDGSILYSPEYAAGLWRVPAAGGVPAPVVMPEAEKGERTYRWPDLLPGGRAVIFTVGSLDSPNDYDSARIVAYTFATKERRVLVNGASMARYLAPGQLVYSHGGTLFAVPFDAERVEVLGPPTPVFEGVAGDASSGAIHFALARDGTFAVVRGGGAQSSRLLTLLDRHGVSTPIPLSARGFRHPRFSPDGARVAFTVDNTASGAGADADVWVYSLTTQALSRLTFDGKSYPLWSPDGSRITYEYPKQQTVLTKPADGGGSEEVVLRQGNDPLIPSSWSPDGRTLAVTSLGPTNDIYLVTPGEAPRLFEKGASVPAFSPDGRWIAYASPAVENSHVFVRPVSGPGKWQVSTEIGSYPRWSRDGRELFYIGTGVGQRPLMAARVTGGDRFSAGPPSAIVPDLSRYMTATAPQLDWDAAPAGDRFVFIEIERAPGEGTRVDVALHWARHLAVPSRGIADAR